MFIVVDEMPRQCILALNVEEVIWVIKETLPAIQLKISVNW